MSIPINSPKTPAADTHPLAAASILLSMLFAMPSARSATPWMVPMVTISRVLARVSHNAIVSFNAPAKSSVNTLTTMPSACTNAMPAPNTNGSKTSFHSLINILVSGSRAFINPCNIAV